MMQNRDRQWQDLIDRRALRPTSPTHFKLIGSPPLTYSQLFALIAANSGAGSGYSEFNPGCAGA
jgi:hypothetical protein